MGSRAGRVAPRRARVWVKLHGCGCAYGIVCAPSVAAAGGWGGWGRPYPRPNPFRKNDLRENSLSLDDSTRYGASSQVIGDKRDSIGASAARVLVHSLQTIAGGLQSLANQWLKINIQLIVNACRAELLR